jgi:hypothetical protein
MIRFSIRDLVWLMTLAAVLLAWAVDHWRLKKSIPRPMPLHPWTGFTLDNF